MNGISIVMILAFSLGASQSSPLKNRELTESKVTFDELVDEAERTFPRVQSIFVDALEQHRDVVAEEAFQLSDQLKIIADAGAEETETVINKTLGLDSSEVTFNEFVLTLRSAVSTVRNEILKTAQLIERLVAQSDVADRVIYISSKMIMDMNETFQPLIDLIDMA